MGITETFIVLRTCSESKIANYNNISGYAHGLARYTNESYIGNMFSGSIVFVGIIEEEYNKENKDEITHLINVILYENGIDNRDLLFLSEKFPVDTNKYTTDSEGSQGTAAGGGAAVGAAAGAGAAASSGDETPCPPENSPTTPEGTTVSANSGAGATSTGSDDGQVQSASLSAAQANPNGAQTISLSAAQAQN